MSDSRNYNNEGKPFKNRKPTDVYTTDPTAGRQKVETEYLYYSKVLSKPFESLTALKEAEAAFFAEQRAKEDKAAQKKADAQKVEEAFKALNLVRKAYKNNLVTIAEHYAEKLKELRAEFENAKTMEQNRLADAETAYANALNAFTKLYPEGYHLTLKDGDFETTISSSTTSTPNSGIDFPKLYEIFDMLTRI